MSAKNRPHPCIGNHHHDHVCERSLSIRNGQLFFEFFFPPLVARVPKVQRVGPGSGDGCENANVCDVWSNEMNKPHSAHTLYALWSWCCWSSIESRFDHRLWAVAGTVLYPVLRSRKYFKARQTMRRSMYYLLHIGDWQVSSIGRVWHGMEAPFFPDSRRMCTKVSTLIVWRVVTMVTIQLLLTLAGVLLFLFIALLGPHSIAQVSTSAWQYVWIV